VADPIYRAPKGTHDVLWPESARRRALVAVFADIVEAAGYTEVVPPMFEHVEVFRRLGDATDVVRKEMYEFEDRGGRHIALRPEQTASIVRSFGEHRPTLPWRAWYAGPNFRYERAQKGRFRQFDQVGIEALGPEDPHLDAEAIATAWRFYESLGLQQVTLLINSLGGPEDRANYIAALHGHFASDLGSLSEESRSTLATNPLRVLDSNRPEDADLIAAAPDMLDHLSADAAAHFDQVQAALTGLEIPFTIQPRLVRGLDYYVRTTFEFTSGAFDAAQNAIGGGGRYDGLAEAMGAPATPGVGFALGVDRTLMACDAEGAFEATSSTVDVFVVDTTGGEAALLITDELRRAGISADRAWDGRSMKSQMRAADRSGAAIAVIVGDDEAESGTASLRDLRGDAGQDTVQRSSITETLLARLK